MRLGLDKARARSDVITWICSDLLLNALIGVACIRVGLRQGVLSDLLLLLELKM